MSEAPRIPVDEGTDLPSVSVLVDGQQISSEYNIVGITIQKAVNRIANAVLTLSDGDPSAQDFPVSNADDFLPGKEVEITAGYHRNETTVFKGLITGHGIKVRGNRPALLVVEMRDAAAKARAASTYCGSFRSNSACSGVFVRSRRTMQDSRLGASSVASCGASAVRFKNVYSVRR